MSFSPSLCQNISFSNVGFPPWVPSVSAAIINDHNITDVRPYLNYCCETGEQVYAYADTQNGASPGQVCWAYCLASSNHQAKLVDGCLSNSGVVAAVFTTWGFASKASTSSVVPSKMALGAVGVLLGAVLGGAL